MRQATEYIAADFTSRIKDKGVTISFVRPSFEQSQHIIKDVYKKSEGNEMAHLVITIGCEYGAKGNQIGKKVAKTWESNFMTGIL